MAYFRENCGEKMDHFLERCFYHPGQYDSEENFLELDRKLKEHEVMYIYIYTYDTHTVCKIYNLRISDFYVGWKGCKSSVLSINSTKYFCRCSQMCQLICIICKWMDKGNCGKAIWSGF